jgi:hypothetical protein
MDTERSVTLDSGLRSLGEHWIPVCWAKDWDLTIISRRQQWKRLAVTLAEKRIGKRCYVLDEENFRTASPGKTPDREDLPFLEFLRKLDCMHWTTVKF